MILKYNPGITIQGEQGDQKVQGNKYYISEDTMWVFNIFNHKTGYHFDFYEMRDFCNKWSLLTVPFIETIKLSNIGSTVQELVEYSKGRSKLNPMIHREGVVIRYINNGKKLLSFKVVNPDFLLKYDEV
jgi:ATP-dependent RNA circularization protein (DNA/RNA ligase family)